MHSKIMIEKKRMIFLILALTILFSVSIISAEIIPTTIPDTQATSTSRNLIQANINQSKIDDGTRCLESRVGDCSSLSFQEAFLTIMAQPSSNVSNLCKNELKKKIIGDNCFGEGGCNIKETAWGIIALNALGENTDKYEKWLLNNTQISRELTWILEIDSNEEANCKATYGGEVYLFKVRTDKKLDVNAGPCLSKTNSDFWYTISSDCYANPISITCDKQFVSSLKFRAQNSIVINLLSNSDEVAPYGSSIIEVKTKCFSAGTDCDYEENLWAALALAKTGNDVSEYKPYIISLSETNTRYLPNAFLYLITNQETDATNLLAEQQLGDYWEQENTPYNKFYDTALALLALGSSQAQQVLNARANMINFLQESSGCWNNNEVRETAILLWAFKGWKGGGIFPPVIPNTNPATTRCEEDANFTCTSTYECDSVDRLSNYYCPSLSQVCCKTAPIKKSCAEMNGAVCDVAAGETCNGFEEEASDEKFCCVGGTCEVKNQTIEETECEGKGSSYYCIASCNSNQEQLNYECTGTDVCCKNKTAKKGSSTWLWILLIILIILIILAIIFRNQLKLWYFKMKSKFKKEKGKPPASPAGMPPRPGFPPVRGPPLLLRRPLPPQSRMGMPPRQIIARPPIQPAKAPATSQRPAPSSTARAPPKKDKMDDVFKKLKDISK